MSNLSSQLQELPALKSVLRRITRTVVRGFPPRRSKRKRVDKRTRVLQKKVAQLQQELADESARASLNADLAWTRQTLEVLNAQMSFNDKIGKLAADPAPTLKLQYGKLIREFESALRFLGSASSKEVQTEPVDDLNDHRETLPPEGPSYEELSKHVNDLQMKVVEQQGELAMASAKAEALQAEVVSLKRNVSELNVKLAEATSEDAITPKGVFDTFKANLAEEARYSGPHGIQKDGVISGFGNAIFNSVHKYYFGDDKVKAKFRKKFELDKLTSSEVDKWLGL